MWEPPRSVRSATVAAASSGWTAAIAPIDLANSRFSNDRVTPMTRSTPRSRSSCRFSSPETPRPITTAVVSGDVKVYPFKTIEDGAVVNTSIVWESKGSRSLFGRDGVTGLANVDVTPELAVKLAMAHGTSVVPSIEEYTATEAVALFERWLPDENLE